jgi:site-specific DNA-cytosine methylase
MKVLVACEESQEVCKAFRALGHEAYSCDILPCSGGHPEWHIQDDVRNVLRHDVGSVAEWDLVIAFPPCTDLAVSGARWFKEKQVNGQQERSIMFFEFFTMLKTHQVAIENPIGIMSTLYRKPDQIIQPWQFGHGETKATCLWLKNLPLLTPTDIVEGREQRIWKMAPSPDRAKIRSKTFPGIARAMASQWSGINQNQKVA